MKTHEHDLLMIDEIESDDSIQLVWRGKSRSRKPSDFLDPLLMGALEAAQKAGKTIVLDFKQVDMINSSSIHAILNLLDSSGEKKVPIKIVYSSKEQWQGMSFSALHVFETKDKRIQVVAE